MDIAADAPDVRRRPHMVHLVHRQIRAVSHCVGLDAALRVAAQEQPLLTPNGVPLCVVVSVWVAVRKPRPTHGLLESI
jgi:hypothetical protein